MDIAELNKRIIDNSNYTVLVFEYTTLIYASDGFERASGYNYDFLKEVDAMWYVEAVHPQDREGVYTTYVHSLKNKQKSHSSTVRIRFRNGFYYWVRYTLKMSFDKDKGIQYTYIYFDNISDLLEKNEVIKSRLNYEKSISLITSELLSNNDDSVDVALDHTLKASKASRVYIFENFLDEDDDLCMKQIKEVCKEGIPPEIGNPDLQHLSYSKSGYGRWAKVLKKNGVITGDIKDFPSDERTLLEAQNIKSIVTIPLFVNHQWFGFIGLDFTEKEVIISQSDMQLLKTASKLFGAFYSNRKYVDLITNQNLNLKDQNIDKDRFVEILAHDLKNSFNNLIYTTDFINNQFDRLDKERVQDLLSSLNIQALNSFNMLNDLLIWSTRRSGKLSVNCTLFDVEKTILGVIDDLRHLADKKDINIVTSVQETSITGDQMIIKTLLRNLLRNAIKFTNPGGLVEIESKRDGSMNYHLSVKDNGIGITKENQEKIWNQTISFSTKGTGNEKGSGLGLLLCKELVDKHNGLIWVDSTPGLGSTFHVKLSEC